MAFLYSSTGAGGKEKQTNKPTQLLHYGKHLFCLVQSIFDKSI